MSKTSIRRLLSGIADFYRGEVAGAGDGSFMLSGVLQAIASTPYPKAAMREDGSSGGRSTLPVCRFVPTLVMPGEGPLSEIGRRFIAAEPAMDWLPGQPAAAAAGLADRYGYVEIVGPGRMFKSPATLVGLMLLAPDVELPEHARSAETLYHVIAGSARWRREGGEWQSQSTGAALYHAAGVRHSIHAGEEPLLVLYCSRGAVETAADETFDQPKTRAKAKKERR